jgi:methylenetetrahydrofolate reductase (NADPH)
MRNGPCGGSTPEHCYVDETRPCIWFRIYERAHRLGREARLLEVLPPLDWDRTGTETWGEVVRSVRKYGTVRFITRQFSRNRELKKESREAVFRPIRQPEWWNGDSSYHPPADSGPASKLEADLQSGKFVITAEIAPPLGTATAKLKEKINMLRDLVSAVNFTDNASASPRMSSMACCSVAAGLGAEPVLQIAARDRTRLGLQSEVIGANPMGVFNVLCISGDNPRTGLPPTSNPNVLDLDAIQMLWILRRMRDEGIYLDGRQMKSPPRLFLGAAASPFASKPEFQALREEKKVNAGAQFFQTNLIFEPEGLDPWLEALDKRNVLDKVYILAGIAPIRSLRMAEHLHYHVPGVQVPLRILEQFRDTREEDHEKLGINLSLEIIDRIRNKKGISGLHFMAVGWESSVPRIMADAGLIPQTD